MEFWIHGNEILNPENIQIYHPGPNKFTRTYQLKKCPEKKWMYVVADCDLSKEFESDFKGVEDAMAKLSKRGFLAVEVRVARFQFMMNNLCIWEPCFRSTPAGPSPTRASRAARLRRVTRRERETASSPGTEPLSFV